MEENSTVLTIINSYKVFIIRLHEYQTDISAIINRFLPFEEFYNMA